MSRLTRASTTVALAVVGAAILLVSASRIWASGTVDDAVLGTSTVSGQGSDVAPGLVALSLAAVAAAIVTTTSGRITRVVTVAVEGLCAVVLAALALRVLLDPSAVLGQVAASSTGRTGSIPTTAAPTVWPWIALLGAVLLGTASATAAVGMRHWRGLSQRYEAPGQDGQGQRAGSRGERVPSEWDRLSAGDDPTED